MFTVDGVHQLDDDTLVLVYVGEHLLIFGVVVVEAGEKSLPGKVTPGIVEKIIEAIQPLALLQPMGDLLRCVTRYGWHSAMERVGRQADRLDRECLGANALLGEDTQGHFDSIFGGEFGITKHLDTNSLDFGRHVRIQPTGQRLVFSLAR